MTTFTAPTVECSRCAGTGHHSYNSLHGSTCYGCNGTGRTYTAKVAAVVEARNTEASRARRAIAQDLAAGDRVWATTDGTRLLSEKRGDGRWVTVENVELTDTVCGWSGPDKIPTAWRVIVTTDAGTTELAGNTILRRYFAGFTAERDAADTLACRD